MSYLTSCPIGCTTSLYPTNIQMPEGQLLQCTGCGHLVSQCSEEKYLSSMQEFDCAEGTSPNESSIKRAAILHGKRLQKIIKALQIAPQEIKLLDIGCSSGAFLDSAKKKGFITYGAEPAPKAAETAAQKGHNVKTGLLEDINYPDNSFDAITLFEVMEHLKEPILLLKEIRRILKPGGIVMISTGNAKSLTVKVLKKQWDYFSIEQHGGHISFFNPKSIELAAQKTKLITYSILTRNIKFANKNAGSSLGYRLLKIGSEILSPLARLFSIGHDMLIILKKPAKQ